MSVIACYYVAHMVTEGYVFTLHQQKPPYHRTSLFVGMKALCLQGNFFYILHNIIQNFISIPEKFDSASLCYDDCLADWHVESCCY